MAALSREQNQKLNDAYKNYQVDSFTKYSAIQKADLKGDGDDLLGNSVVDQQSLLTPVLAEYERNLEEQNGQLKYYQKQMGEMKVRLQTVIKENERLHSELKEAVEKQLEALPLDTEIENDTHADDETVRSLQEQLQLANQEKHQAVELWQTVSQELERLQKIYQEHMTEAQIHVFESQKQKNQLTSFQQLTKRLHLTNENIEMTNQHYVRAVSEQSVEIEQLRKQLRQAKLELRAAAAKVEELTTAAGDLQGQMKRMEEDVASAQGREEASDRRLQQLQTTLRQLEARLRVEIQEANQLKAEKTHLEKQTADLQAKCQELEGEKFEAIVQARNSMQLLEEAHLQKHQALLEEKQKEEEMERMKETLSRVVQDAAVRTRKEVVSTRKQYNAQISQLTEELSALQMVLTKCDLNLQECGEKQSQIERAIREKKAVEEELEKVCQEGRGSEGDRRRLEEMHQRCLLAERARDELQLRLRTAENSSRQREMNSSEEISRCQEMIQKLQNVLESERENCGLVSEQRLKLQQENEQLQKETEALRKAALQAQKQARLKISTMEHEFSVREHGLEAQLRELEDSGRSSTVELRHLLVTQQKAASKWRAETKKLTENAETRVRSLKSELSRQKLQTQELLSQLEMAHNKAAENEKLLQEHQEKAARLQRRLTQAEQRAAAAAQQLGAAAVQRRRAASMMNLDSV